MRATPRMLGNSYATIASNVFDEMGARDCLHDATAKFLHLLDDNTVDIDQAPIEENCARKTLKAKKELTKKKAQEKQEKWLLLKEEGLCKAAIEESKGLAE
ncbi:putative galacturonosyltransferase 14 [Hordeum vulgare]|nr:putative galacturonosyltransferase 14 [Hordeum vulgare]